MGMKLNSFDLVIGFDTEYVRVDLSQEDENVPANAVPIEEQIKAGNRVVCYSVAIYNPATGQKTSACQNIEPLRAKRWSITTLLQKTIRLANKHGLISTERIQRAEQDNDKIKIALAAHFSRADLPGFSDFEKLKKRFDAVRKTYATVRNPAVFQPKIIKRRPSFCSVRLYDTRLLAPTGSGSLDKLGALLGIAKLSVPEVENKSSQMVAGITRMDIVQRDHPVEFENYAIRDAQIAVSWLIKIDEFRENWNLDNLGPTIGSLGAAKIRQVLGEDECEFLGLEHGPTSKRRNDMVFKSGIVNNISFIANSFHGGRNETFVHGIYDSEPQRPYLDWDLAGAYSTGMAFLRMPDWSNPIHTTDLEALLDIDTCAVAQVKFEFPPDTRFPSLPVDAIEMGLIYPLTGTSYCTGLELKVAQNQGATIKVLAGLKFRFSTDNERRPLVDFIQAVNIGRAQSRLDSKTHSSPLELLYKECGNSGYGKIAQAVARHKTTPGVHTKNVFNTRTGEMAELEGSPITNPLFAAVITGLIRAVVSEILCNLPSHVQVVSVTTDGWLSDATTEEVTAATRGPLCTLFRQLRTMVSTDGSDEIVELKKSALKVLSCKTRGAFTIKQGGPLPETVILARAGYSLEKHRGSDLETSLEFIRIFSNRTADTKMLRRDFISIREQWVYAADLIDIPKKITLNLDFDWKRQHQSIRHHNRLLCFETNPWKSVEDFYNYRLAFDKWRLMGNVCAVLEDLSRFEVWHQNGADKRSPACRTKFQDAVFKNWSSGQDGFPRRTKGKNKGMSTVEIANFLTEIGFDNVTAKKVEKASSLKDPITLSSSDLTETDLYQATKILELLGSTPLKTCVHNFDERLFCTS